MRLHCSPTTAVARVALLVMAMISVDASASAPPASGADDAGRRAAALPQPQFVYVADAGGNTISEYHIRPNGVLALIGRLKTGGGPRVILADSWRPYVYVLSEGASGVGGEMDEYQAGAHGLLHQIGVIRSSDSVDMAIGPMGRHVYVQSRDATVGEYAVGAEGLLRRVGTAADAEFMSHIRVDATGRYLFGVDRGDPSLRSRRTIDEYAIARGGVTTALGRYPTGLNPVIATDPAGPYVYVANSPWDGQGGHPEISGYVIGHGGVLKPIGTRLTKDVALAIAVSTDGRYVYASFGNNTVSRYAIEAHGTLRQRGSQPTQRLPVAIAMGRGGDIYVANAESDTVSEYTAIGDGALIAPGVMAARGEDRSLTIDAGGRSAYLVEHGSPPRFRSTIVEYSIGARGALTLLPRKVATTSTSPVVMADQGRYAYQIDQGHDGALEYAVGPQGHLVPIGHLSTNLAQIRSVAVDPAHPYVYFSSDNGIGEYVIGSGGGLQKIGRVGHWANELSIDPAGRHLYASVWHAVDEYDIGSRGTLTKFGSVPVADNIVEPVVWEGSGRYAYKLDTHLSRKSGRLVGLVTEYAVAPDGGLRMVGHLSTSAVGPSLWIDPWGPYVFLSSITNGLVEYRVSSHGALVLVGSAFPGLYNVDSITISPAGPYLYAGHRANGGQTFYYTVLIGSHGELKRVGSVATGHGPWSIVSAPY